MFPFCEMRGGNWMTPCFLFSCFSLPLFLFLLVFLNPIADLMDGRGLKSLHYIPLLLILLLLFLRVVSLDVRRVYVTFCLC